MTFDAKTILIVDDNADCRELLAELFTACGHLAHQAEDGAAALRAVAEQRPHVVVLDIGLPDMDGYEVAARIRAAPGNREVLLIALSGYGQPEHRRKSLEAGCNVHLLKPVDINELMTEIQAV
jgi:CheY-like chemotaxis protein